MLSSFSLDDLNTLIEGGDEFRLVRYGDGEWICMLGVNPYGGDPDRNCDGHYYFEDLSDALRNSLEKPRKDTLYGMQHLSLMILGDSIQKYIKKHCPGITWYDSDILHHANEHEKLGSFIDVVRQRETVFVGPSHLDRIVEFLHADAFLRIPNVDCWRVRDQLLVKVKEMSKHFENPLFLMSASMMTNNIIHKYEGRGSFVDCGSIWEPHCGRTTRGYHRKVKRLI